MGTELSLQQQSVLLLATRGPDGTPKSHPCKPVHVAYRGTVLLAAKYGRALHWGESADGFMSLDQLSDDERWGTVIRAFFRNHDSLPAHYRSHLMHGAQIVGYKHPDVRFRGRWFDFYERMVEDLHLNVETEAEMDARLSDWGRQGW